MRYQWSALNNQQKGSFGEHFAKMEFAMYGFLVFTAEVDDRGIDFVARNEKGNHFDVQVKTITGRNYTFVKESKFAKSLLICLVVLEDGRPPDMFLLRGSDWDKDTDNLLRKNSFPNAKEPEYGIHLTKTGHDAIQQFRFEHTVGALR
jgi:hypothetical protein